jgi:hypothetical protein
VSVANAANQQGLWDFLKNQGVGGLPSGPTNVAGQTLVHLLLESRVLVVPVGEMEDFDKSTGLHGAASVSEMLARGAMRRARRRATRWHLS